jgi:hypothetical protein
MTSASPFVHLMNLEWKTNQQEETEETEEAENAVECDGVRN